jgi:hypothetical protein
MGELAPLLLDFLSGMALYFIGVYVGQYGSLFYRGVCWAKVRGSKAC